MMKYLKQQRYGLAQVTLFLLVTLSCTACSTTEINYFSDAQRLFSETASKDNSLNQNLSEITVSTDLTQLPVEFATVEAGYAGVISMLKSMPKDQRTKLEKTKLWGNALVLISMSYWRLGNYDEATLSSKQALDQYGSQLGTRDRVLLKLLPGLIHNDELYVRMQKQLKNSQTTPKKALEIQDGFIKAMDLIKQVKSDTKEKHSIKGYILIAHLSAYSNLMKSCLLDKKTNDECIDKQRCDAFESYLDLKKVSSSMNQPLPILDLIQRDTIGLSDKTIKADWSKCQQ